MKRCIVVLVLTFLAFLFVSPVAFAKGPADKITISGPGLAMPIEITDRATLNRFSPWSDEFFDLNTGTLAEEPETNSLYEVQFYLKDSAGELVVRYGFLYAPGEPGYIYFPGKDNEGYQRNVGLMIRDQDGGWVYASQAWESFVSVLLAGVKPSLEDQTGKSDNARDDVPVVRPSSAEQDGAVLQSVLVSAPGISTLTLFPAVGVLVLLIGIIFLAARIIRRSPA
jgi:hypothetical protein